MQTSTVRVITLRELLKRLSKSWLLVLAFMVLFAAGFGAISMYYISPVYRAESTLYLGKNSGTTDNITIYDLQINDQLVLDYQELIQSRNVAKEVIANTGYDLDVDAYLENIAVTTVSGSRIFRISYESTDPKLAADIINETVRVIIRRASEMIKISNVIQIDEAEVPAFPVRPDTVRSIAAGAVVGLLLGCLAVFLKEVFNKTFRRVEDVESVLHFPVLGRITNYRGEPKNYLKKKNYDYTRSIITLLNQNAPASEGYRLLRTYLTYSGRLRRAKTIAVTSPSTREGKSSVAANLAISFALAGRRVLIIDGDLRSPKLHQHFDVYNGIGLSTLLKTDENPMTVVKAIEHVPNLNLMTSGPASPHAPELLDSDRMKAVLEQVKASYDMIIIDTPPVTQAADTSIISALAEGMLLVVTAGTSRIDDAVQATRYLSLIDSHILGIVVTRLHESEMGTYPTYSHRETGADENLIPKAKGLFNQLEKTYE